MKSVLAYIVMIIFAIALMVVAIKSRSEFGIGGEVFVFSGLMAYAIGHLIEGKEKEDE